MKTIKNEPISFADGHRGVADAPTGAAHPQKSGLTDLPEKAKIFSQPPPAIAATQAAMTTPDTHPDLTFNGPVHAFDLRKPQGHVQQFVIEEKQDFNLQLRFDSSCNLYLFTEEPKPSRVTIQQSNIMPFQRGGAFVTHVYTWTSEALRVGPRPFRIHMVSFYNQPYPIEVHLTDLISTPHVPSSST